MLLVALQAYKKSKPTANNSIVKRLNGKKKNKTTYRADKLS